jgi:hypothetical protein
MRTVLALVALLASSQSSVAQLPARDFEDQYAYRTVLELLALAERGSRSRAVTGEDAITLGMSAEVGIILLERSSSKEALRGLANLNLVRLDGAVAERHNCAVLSKGSNIVPLLKEALSGLKPGSCVPPGIRIARETAAICAAPESVRRVITSQIDAITRGRKCSQ